MQKQKKKNPPAIQDWNGLVSTESPDFFQPAGCCHSGVLSGFGAQVTVISPAFAGQPDGVQLLCRAYSPGDCAGYALVIILCFWEHFAGWNPLFLLESN